MHARAGDLAERRSSRGDPCLPASPGLWIVVKPAISVAYAFAAVDNIDCTGVSPSLRV